jgi:hypothetical protein
MWLMRFEYLNDTWNVIDVLKGFFTMTYLISKVTDYDEGFESIRFFWACAILMAWIRMIGFFRISKATRYLIRMIIEIVSGIVPFMIIFLISIFAICLSHLALRGENFWDEWIIAFRMGLGDFGDTETEGEKFLFYFFSLALPVIMLNLLIAMMGDIYSEVQEN